jgi:hypothetical protein
LTTWAFERRPVSCGPSAGWDLMPFVSTQSGASLGTPAWGSATGSLYAAVSLECLHRPPTCRGPRPPQVSVSTGSPQGVTQPSQQKDHIPLRTPGAALGHQGSLLPPAHSCLCHRWLLEDQALCSSLGLHSQSCEEESFCDLSFKGPGQFAQLQWPQDGKMSIYCVPVSVRSSRLASDRNICNYGFN